MRVPCCTAAALQVAYLSFSSSSWSFVVRRPLQWSKVTAFSFSQHSAEQWRQINAQIVQTIETFAKRFMAPRTEVVWLLSMVRNVSRKNRIPAPAPVPVDLA